MELRRWRLFGEASLAFSGRATPFFRVAYGAESVPRSKADKDNANHAQLLFGSGAFDWPMRTCCSGFGILIAFLFHRFCFIGVAKLKA